jgi:RNA-directed DNA polymerase
VRFGLCRPVSVGEDIPLQDLHRAWRAARQHKKPSSGQTRFDTEWAERLIELQTRLQAGTWSPAPSTCFIARRPKAREIHAPAFSDRVVHHWLVPQLEALFEPGFIHDSYSNRIGKGTHEAVQRLTQFVRQVHSGEGGGWYLQLDIRNFFNSIHRPTLYAMLKRRMERAGLSLPARQATHALLRGAPTAQGVRERSTVAERALVPSHKRLSNAPAGRGLPIGNLSSQFFANVYLDALDQFVKHRLKAGRYLRYVDDFVLVHHDREQLVQWQAQIETFLHAELGLQLKDDIKLRPLTAGIDFLGYVIRPTHTTVRRRVVSHARQALSLFEQRNTADGVLTIRREQRRAIGAVWASYQGHFRHADSHRLIANFHRRYPWLTPFEAA